MMETQFPKYCKNIKLASRPLAVGASIQQNVIKPTRRKVQILAEPLPGKPCYRDLPPLIGNYIIDSTKRTPPAYSMGRKFIRSAVDLAQDGPAKFDISGLSNRGSYRTKGILIKSRIPEFKKFPTPGVGKYEPDCGYKATSKGAPQYSFGVKPKVIKPFLTPGPNVYNLPPVVGTAKEGNKRAAPAFSMLSREKPRQIPPFISPGPGEYENNINYVKKKSPKYTMRCLQSPELNTKAFPGPAHYCPEKYIKSKSTPAPSFAIHHSPYIGESKAYLIKPCNKSLNII